MEHVGDCDGDECNNGGIGGVEGDGAIGTLNKNTDVVDDNVSSALQRWLREIFMFFLLP